MKVDRRHMILLPIAICLLLGGWRWHASPVVPTGGRYVNDYGVVVVQNHRDFILETSRELYGLTGAEVAVLTVPSLSGMDISEYAQQVAEGWELGGAMGNQGVLLLYEASSQELYIWAGAAFDGVLGESALSSIGDMHTALYLEDGNPSKAIQESYKVVVSLLYRHFGLEPGDALGALLEPGVENTESSDIFYLAIAFVLMMLIALRGLFISRKYMKRFGKPKVYKRKKFSQKPRAFDSDGNLTGYDD